MKRVWLALGSNLGDREANLRSAIAKLQSQKFHIHRVSPVYETAPQDFPDQNWFLNLVLTADTALMPLQLLAHCEHVERDMKRQRTVPKGPRTIDIDVLFYGRLVIQTGRLQIPHPRYRQRRFVLQPLSDLDPGFRDPVTHRPITDMLAHVSDQPIRASDIVITA